MTTQSFSSRARGLAVVLCLAGAASASAQAAKAPADPEKAVRARVEEYWKARSTMNLQSVQPFYDPDFRTKYAPDAFARDFRRLNRFAPEFLGVESVAVDADGKKATAKVKLRTKPDVLQGQELISVVEEVWLKLDGGWFRQAEALLPNL